MIWFLINYNGPLRKHVKSFGMPCTITRGLNGRGCLRNLEKALDVAYHDILNKFDLTWGFKGLIVTRSNLVVTWKNGPQMSIILDFHSGCVILAGLVVFWVLFAINFSICSKKERGNMSLVVRLVFVMWDFNPFSRNIYRYVSTKAIWREI